MQKMTCDIYNEMKDLLISPVDDRVVAAKYGFGERTVRNVRKSSCFAEYQAELKTRRINRDAALERITEICDNATYDRQNLKYASRRKVVGRTIGGGELKFVNKNTIELYYGNYRVVFFRHRGRGVYALNWRPFRKALAEAKPMDVGRVWELADRFDISHSTTRAQSEDKGSGEAEREEAGHGEH